MGTLVIMILITTVILWLFFVIWLAKDFMPLHLPVEASQYQNPTTPVPSAGISWGRLSPHWSPGHLCSLGCLYCNSHLLEPTSWTQLLGWVQKRLWRWSCPLCPPMWQSHIPPHLLAHSMAHDAGCAQTCPFIRPHHTPSIWFPFVRWDNWGLKRRCGHTKLHSPEGVAQVSLHWRHWLSSSFSKHLPRSHILSGRVENKWKQTD